LLFWCIIWLRRRKRSAQDERHPAAAVPRPQEHIQMQLTGLARGSTLPSCDELIARGKSVRRRRADAMDR